jgi:hypothetical protein
LYGALTLYRKFVIFNQEDNMTTETLCPVCNEKLPCSCEEDDWLKLEIIKDQEFSKKIQKTKRISEESAKIDNVSIL